MQRIQLDEDVKPLSEFRANVASFIERIQKTKRPLVITQRGKSAAVMLDVAEYETLLKIGAKGRASKAMGAQALGHYVIVFFILLGNVFYLINKWFFKKSRK